MWYAGGTIQLRESDAYKRRGHTVSDTCDQKENCHCFNKSLCGMQREEEQQMLPSEIAAQPASDSPSTSQVIGPHKGVKPFPGNFHHFTVKTGCE